MARENSDQPTIKRYSLSLLQLVLLVFSSVGFGVLSRYHAGIVFQPGYLEVLQASSTIFVYFFLHPLPVMRYIAWWCLLIACVCFLFLPVRVQVMVAFAGSLWMVYYTIGREMRYIKPVLVAGVWVLVTHWMVLPMALWWHSWQEGAARLMFVFALALGYDLLDRPFDAGRATPTLALHWGSTLTFRVAALALCLMVTIIATMPISGTQKGLETLVPVASIFLMYRISSHPNAAPIPNKIAIDSMMALQILLSLLAS